MRAMVMTLGFAAALLGADPRGLKPRSGPADYPAQDAGRDVTIAAAVLTPEQVKSTFSTDMKQYLVIEVGVFPAQGQTIDVAAGDFALRAGDQGNVVRAANPRAIAAANQRKNAPPPDPQRASDVTIYPTATVGVASGTDPWTGRRTSGVYTGAGVGVGIGGNGGGISDPPRPASTDRDREVMQQELTDQMLPEGKITAPAAGYLYFPYPQKAKTVALELQYYAAGGKIRVPLPPLPRGR